MRLTKFDDQHDLSDMGDDKSDFALYGINLDVG